jgi:hypothetical protein
MKNFQCDVMRKKKLHPIADQFSDDDMNQIEHFGQMLSGGVTPFDEAVEEALNKREVARKANAKKMKAAQTGAVAADVGLGPSQMDEASIKQRGAIASRATTQGAAQAQAAQAQQRGCFRSGRTRRDSELTLWLPSTFAREK